MLDFLNFAPNVINTHKQRVMRLHAFVMLPSVKRVLQSNTPTQGTDAWLEWRKTRLTASDACMLTGDAVKTRAKLLVSKTTPGTLAFSGNSYTESGHINEPIAARRYAEHTDRELFTDIKPVEHPEHNFLAASLDAVTSCGRNVEIKTLHAEKAFKKPKPIHVKQAQIQMACTGLAVTDLVYYYPNIEQDGIKKLDIHSIKYDNVWFESVLPKFKSFAEDLAKAHACCYNIELEDWRFDGVMTDIESAFDNVDMDDMDLMEQAVVWPIDTRQCEWI